MVVKLILSLKILQPVTYNDHDLVSKMLPSLEKVAGKDNVTFNKG